jgi:hypothetical protein
LSYHTAWAKILNNTLKFILIKITPIKPDSLYDNPKHVPVEHYSWKHMYL